MKVPPRVQTWALLLGGAATLAGGVWFALEAQQFVDSAERTDGVVVEIVSRRNARGMSLDHPVVRFQPLAGGSTVTFTGRPGLWPSPFEAGQSVEVAYPADRPDEARVVSFWTLWLMPVLMGLFGAICVAAGWSSFHSDRRDPSR